MKWLPLGFLAGFLGNLLLDRPIDKIFHFRRGLNLMARYAAGGILTIGVCVAMVRRSLPRENQLTAIMAFCTAFLTVGAGAGFARALSELLWGMQE